MKRTDKRAAARSDAQRALQREHGEDGEHWTFPGVSTMAHSASAGGAGCQVKPEVVCGSGTC